MYFKRQKFPPQSKKKIPLFDKSVDSEIEMAVLNKEIPVPYFSSVSVM